MLGEAEANLHWKEERRTRLAQCKQNLENVPSTDTIYFLQVGWGEEKELIVLSLEVLSCFMGSWVPGALGCSLTPAGTVPPYSPLLRGTCSQASPGCDSGEADVLPRPGTDV